MTNSRDDRTENTAYGSPRAVVQAGTVHGGIHIASSAGLSAPVPRQLPLSATGFVDRATHLRRLDALAEEAQVRVPVAVLSGPPGVGKTALAVHWAHSARTRFPGGCLYVGVHAHAPGPRAEASQALDSLLRALGAPPDRIPLSLDGRSALYRTETDGRRLLIVIDDVLAPAQVRPLLPASPGCMVVVTSRGSLPGLVAREGAHRLSLDVLPMADSVALLRNTVGPRVDAESGAAHDLAEHCARLPLALRVAAERLIDRPGASLSDLVTELAAEESRLDTLSEEDELSDLRAVMSASYLALDDETARFFRVLGVHPGAELSSGAASALTGTRQAAARRFLDRLTRAHLVERVREDRYRLHDLVRLYAVERVEAEGGPQERSEAVGRVARWYTHAAARAQTAEHPHFPVVPGYEPPDDLPSFSSLGEALVWFEQERTNLLAATGAAFDLGHLEIAWRLPVSVYPLFELHRHWEQWCDLHGIGLRAAENAGSVFGAARNHLGMGDALWLSGNLDAAVRHYRAALSAGREVEDPWVEGFSLRQLGTVLWQRGEREDGTAVRYIKRAVAVFREAGEERGAAMGLLGLAEIGADLEYWDEAFDHCRSAIAVFEEIGAAWSTAWARCTLGRVLTATGRADRAVAEYAAAVREFEVREDPDSRAVALIGWGEAHLALGEPARAGEMWRAALEYLRDRDDPRADGLAERLAALER
ncbi:ATP-binding protein [Nocardiopsis flavescens]